jgi:hypothetical protein
MKLFSQYSMALQAQAKKTGAPQNFGKPWEFRQMLGKIKKMWADLSEKILNLGHFVTILHTYSGKISTTSQSMVGFG